MGGAGGARSLNASPGLASVNAATGTLIVFATDPGNVAEDGLGIHSPFTTALLEHIEKPGLEIRQIMALVRGSVRSATKGRQIPWESASLEGDFYLHPIARTAQLARAGTAETSSAALDRLFWESVKDPGDTAELEAYLARFPDGVFATVARARLTRVRLSGPSAAGSATPTAASPAKPSSTAPGVAATATVGGNPAPPSANSPPTARAAFDPDKVPFAKSREDLRNYAAYKGDKALALGASGVSWWMPTARQALEACEFWSREPCLLYAVGNWVEPAPDGRRPVRPTLGPGEGNFDRERVPFVSDGVRASLSVYVTAQNPKALAISPNGIYGLAADSLSMEETQRVALDRCLAAERDHPFRKPCFLYAVDDWVVLAKRATAPLVARKRFNPETVPITVNRSPARTYMNLPEEKAFAISPSGKHHWLRPSVWRSKAASSTHANPASFTRRMVKSSPPQTANGPCGLYCRPMADSIRGGCRSRAMLPGTGWRPTPTRANRKRCPYRPSARFIGRPLTARRRRRRKHLRFAGRQTTSRATCTRSAVRSFCRGVRRHRYRHHPSATRPAGSRANRDPERRCAGIGWLL